MFDSDLLVALETTVDALRDVDYAVATAVEVEDVLRRVLACTDALLPRADGHDEPDGPDPATTPPF